jgi:hypothetical protein
VGQVRCPCCCCGYCWRGNGTAAATPAAAAAAPPPPLTGQQVVRCWWPGPPLQTHAAQAAAAAVWGSLHAAATGPYCCCCCWWWRPPRGLCLGVATAAAIPPARLGPKGQAPLLLLLWCCCCCILCLRLAALQLPLLLLLQLLLRVTAAAGRCVLLPQGRLPAGAAAAADEAPVHHGHQQSCGQQPGAGCCTQTCVCVSCVARCVQTARGAASLEGCQSECLAAHSTTALTHLVFMVHNIVCKGSPVHSKPAAAGDGGFC